MSSEPAGSSLVMELPLPPRPAMYIKTVTFSDGTNINLEEDDIVVFVGPNNAGKSAALKEIQAWFGNEPTHVVTKEVTFKTHGDKDAFQNYLDRTAMLVGDVPDQQNYAGMGFSIYKGHLPFFGQNVNKNLFADFLSTRLRRRIE